MIATTQQTDAPPSKLRVLISDLRTTLELLKRADYTRQAVTETSPAFLIGWTRRELERAIETLEAVDA